MKKFKSVRPVSAIAIAIAIAAAMVSTAVLAGGLGLGLGVDAGVNVGGLGAQTRVEQRADADANIGGVGASARQSTNLQGDVVSSERAARSVQASPSSNNSARVQSGVTTPDLIEMIRPAPRVSASATATVDSADRISSGISGNAHRVQMGARDRALSEHQAAAARSRRLHANERVAGAVRTNEQVPLERSGRASLKANIKSNAELYSGG